MNINKPQNPTIIYFEDVTFTYLMKDPFTGFIKIGKSRSPRAREITLQSQNISTTLMYYAFSDIFLEKQLHQEYKEFRIRGEWFDLNETQVSELVRKIWSSHPLNNKDIPHRVVYGMGVATPELFEEFYKDRFFTPIEEDIWA